MPLIAGCVASVDVSVVSEVAIDPIRPPASKYKQVAQSTGYTGSVYGGIRLLGMWLFLGRRDMKCASDSRMGGFC